MGSTPTLAILYSASKTGGLHVRFSFGVEILSRSILDSIVVSIPACHAGDQGSIPCRGALFEVYTKTLSTLPSDVKVLIFSGLILSRDLGYPSRSMDKS